MINKISKIVLLILVITFSISINKNTLNASVGEYMHCIDILDSFDEKSFLSLDDIDITQSELESIKGYFEKEGIILSTNTKHQNHENIYKWIKKNIEYETSSNRAYDVFLNKKGVCEGFSQLYKVLCYLCGISNVISNGTLNGVAHAWNYIYLDEWYEIDITNSIYDDIFKNDMSGYKDEYLTPCLYKDNDFLYYYSHGICVKPISSNNSLPKSINGLIIDCYDEYLPHMFNEYKNDKIEEIELYENSVYISKNYFKSFSNLKYIKGKNTKNGIYYESDKEVYIPPMIEIVRLDLEVVSKETISNLVSLKEVVFLEGVKEIEKDAIINCPNLTKITLPKSIEKIECAINNVYYTCKNDVAFDFLTSNNLLVIDERESNIIDEPTLDIEDEVDEKSSNTEKVVIIVLMVIGGVVVSVILLKTMKENYR